MSDPVSSALVTMQMNGALFTRAELSAPWGISSGQVDVGIFHAVVSGSCYLLTAGHEPLAVEAGDVVYLPAGAEHTLADQPDRSATPRSGMRTIPATDGMELLEVAGDGPHTTLLCGTVAIDDSDIHPLIALLPPVVHVRHGADDDPTYVPTIIELLAREVSTSATGASVAASRLTDVLVIYVLRRYVEQLDHRSVGWLAALRDPAVAQALELIHRQPERPWTAAELAASVGMSRSSFFARFRALVGETPSDYLTRWRMHLASRHLRDGCSVAAAARAVGYASEAGFSNAFLRITGLRPSAYRERLVA